MHSCKIVGADTTSLLVYLVNVFLTKLIFEDDQYVGKKRVMVILCGNMNGTKDWPYFLHSKTSWLQVWKFQRRKLGGENCVMELVIWKNQNLKAFVPMDDGGKLNAENHYENSKITVE